MTTVNKTLQNHIEFNISEKEDISISNWAPIVNSDGSKIISTEIPKEQIEDLLTKNKENNSQSICLKLKPEQSYKKETKASRLGKSTGRWTSKEHLLFIEGLKIYGKNWKKVESFIGTRTGTQIRSHAQKFFNRIRKEFNTEDPSKYVP